MNQDEWGTETGNSFHRRWYVYLAWPLLFVAMMGFVVLIAGFGGAETLMPLYLLFGVAIFVLGVWALIGYYYDARALRNVNSSWVPRWYLWAAGHILITPLVITPIYLIRRTTKTGLPPRVASLFAD